MPTGDKSTNFADKRRLPQQRIKDTFFDYLAAQLREVTSRVWSSQRGVFGSITLTAATDEVSAAVLPQSLLDGDGNVLVLDGANGDSLKIENALAATYEVAARHVLIPSGVVQNPRLILGAVDYDLWEDEIGDGADPDSLVEAAGQLNMIVDSVFEAGVTHAGRLVTVYLKRPVTTVEAVAIERNVVVTWDGSNNRILTAALLGQPGGGASTSAVDYTVVAQGLTIRRNTVLSTLDPYAFIGTATGTGAGNVPTVSVVGQIDITDGINPSLDEAYNNSGVAAKIITLDDGAVELLTPATPGDGQNAQFRMVRMGNTDWMQFMLVAEIGDTAAIPIAVFEPVRSSGGELNEQEVVDQVAPDLLNFTRGGALDLQDPALRIDVNMHVVLLETGPEAGTLLVIKGINSGSQLQVMGLQSSGVPAAWTVGVGRTARVLVPRMILAGSVPHQELLTLDYWKGLLINCRDGQQNDVPVRFMPDGHTAIDQFIRFYNNEAVPKVSAGLTAEGVWDLGAFTPDEILSGFNIVTHPQGVGNADKHSHVIRAAPLVQLNDDLPTHRTSALLGENGAEHRRFTPWGRMARTSYYYEDMMLYTLPTSMVTALGGGASVLFNPAAATGSHGGVAVLATGAGTPISAELRGPMGWVIDNTPSPEERIVNFYAKLRIIASLADRIDEVGLTSRSGTAEFMFRFAPLASADWRAIAKDGVTENVGATNLTATAGSQAENDEFVEFMAKIDVSINTVSFWATGMTSFGVVALPNAGANWEDEQLYPRVTVINAAAADKKLEIDVWEVWDEIIKGGPKE